MGTETTDIIDDVLKESEELLDRIKLNDLYDGGASLASLGSEVYSVQNPTGLGTSLVLESPQVKPTVTALSIQSDDGTLSGNIAPSNGVDLSSPTIPLVSKWEKVSSAAAGDDDYVPIVDYSKEKRTSQDLPTISVKSKVSRLEAYREKSRQRRRRRTMMIAIVTALVTMVWWWVRSNGKRSTTFNNNHDLGNLTNDTLETGIGGVDNTTFSSGQGAFETCPWDSIEAFFMIIEELRCSQGGLDMIALEANNTNNDDLDGLKQTTDGNHSAHSKTIVTWSPDEKKCRNPIVRLFSKKCRILWREKKKKLKENSAKH